MAGSPSGACETENSAAVSLAALIGRKRTCEPCSSRRSGALAGVQSSSAPSGRLVDMERTQASPTDGGAMALACVMRTRWASWRARCP
jgi:hypothetical protein